MVATTGAFLGGTLLGLLALPAWLRRFERVDAPPGDPRRRLRQDRVVTALLSALAMATLTVSALVVVGVEYWSQGRPSAWAGVAPENELVGTEIDEILALIETGSPTQAAVGMEQLLELVAGLPVEAIDAVAAAHERVGMAIGWSHERSHALRDALRRSEYPEAAAALADGYEHIEDENERRQTLGALGRCADPAALIRVIDSERERYRTPLIAERIITGCIHHVTHELLALANAHPAERSGVYEAMADACDFQPQPMQSSAGAAIAEQWVALGERTEGEQAIPANHWLAHALACASDELLEQALTTVPPGADDWTRAEVELAAYRRRVIDMDTLLQRALENPALRRRLQEHYAGSAPWEDPVMELDPNGFPTIRRMPEADAGPLEPSDNLIHHMQEQSRQRRERGSRR